MRSLIPSKRVNTILYCQKWAEMVCFYRDKLALPTTVEHSWFLEFQLAPSAYLSLADAARTTIKSSQGAGLTITFEVDDIETVWQKCQAQGLRPEPIKQHHWGALQFFMFDPEGYRLEIWQLLERSKNSER